MITRVQNQTGLIVGTPSTSFVISIAPTDGNFQVIGFTINGGTVVSVTQTGATWTQAAAASISADVPATSIWYAPNASSASTTVTVTFSGNVASYYHYAEYSGLALTSVLDQTATNTGSSTTVDSGTTATTSQASELWLAILSLADGASSPVLGSPSNGFTQIDQDNDATFASAFEENIVSSTGAANTSAISSFTGDWAAAIATFKAPAVATSKAVFKIGKGMHVQTTSQNLLSM